MMMAGRTGPPYPDNLCCRAPLYAAPSHLVRVVVETVAHVAAVLDSHREGFSETERQERFGRHVDRLPVRVDLRTRACRGAHGRADGRSLAAARDGADDCSEQRAAADINCRVLVRADRPRAILDGGAEAGRADGIRVRIDGVALAVDGQ